jgi:hypothetical protein
MGGVAEEEHALAGQIGAVDRGDHQGRRRRLSSRSRLHTGDLGHLGDEIAGGADADRHGLGVGLAQVRSIQRRRFRPFRDTSAR